MPGIAKRKSKRTGAAHQRQRDEKGKCTSCEKFFVQPWLADLIVPASHFGVVRLASRSVKSSLSVLGPRALSLCEGVDLARFYVPSPGHSLKRNEISLSRLHSIYLGVDFPQTGVHSACLLLSQVKTLKHLSFHWTHTEAVSPMLRHLAVQKLAVDCVGRTLASIFHSLAALILPLRCQPSICDISVQWDQQSAAIAAALYRNVISDTGMPAALRRSAMVRVIDARDRALGALPAVAVTVDADLCEIGSLVYRAGPRQSVLATVALEGPAEDSRLMRCAVKHFAADRSAVSQLQSAVSGHRPCVLSPVLEQIAHDDAVAPERRALLASMVMARTRDMLAAIPNSTEQYRSASELGRLLIQEEVRSENAVCDLVKAAPPARVLAVLRSALALGIVNDKGLVYALAFCVMRRTFRRTAAVLATQGPAALDAPLPPSAERQREFVQAAMEIAVEQGSVCGAERLLALGADANRRQCKTGLPPLHQATLQGHAEVMQLLLRRGAAVDGESEDGETALVAAVRAGSVEAARVLLQAGAAPNVTSRQMHRGGGERWGRSTAVHEAVAAGSCAVLEVLLEGGCDVNARDSNGCTPLHVACGSAFWADKDEQPRVQVARVLLAAGADRAVKTPRHAEWSWCGRELGLTGEELAECYGWCELAKTIRDYGQRG